MKVEKLKCWEFFLCRLFLFTVNSTYCTLAALTLYITAPSKETSCLLRYIFFLITCMSWYVWILQIRTRETSCKVCTQLKPPFFRVEDTFIPLWISFLSDKNVHVFYISQGFSRSKLICIGYIQYRPESTYTKNKEKVSCCSCKKCSILSLLAEFITKGDISQTKGSPRITFQCLWLCTVFSVNMSSSWME